MKKQYTNAEKIAYFQKQLVDAATYYENRANWLLKKIDSLKALNGNDYQSQDWSGDLSYEIGLLRERLELRQIEKDIVKAGKAKSE